MKYLLLTIYFFVYFDIISSVHAQIVCGCWKNFGEQNSGIYTNPIIPSDYSGIDCIQVGDDYYAISSTLQFSPGMTILHSKDLVNYEICGPRLDIQNIWLQSQCGLDGNSQFYYSLDGEIFTSFAESYQLVWGNYRGDRLGIYSLNARMKSGI